MTTPSSVPHTSLKYRPDIDGLRAVAVLIVVFFHLGLPLKGGFIGVDVFFVISGFLIGSIILGQITAGTFTLSGFYERRIRRILPALMAMMAVTCFLAYRSLLPKELIDFARSLISAACCRVQRLFLDAVGVLRRSCRLRSRSCTPGRWPSKSSST